LLVYNFQNDIVKYVPEQVEAYPHRQLLTKKGKRMVERKYSVQAKTEFVQPNQKLAEKAAQMQALLNREGGARINDEMLLRNN